jgi:hypothetical protein
MQHNFTLKKCTIYTMTRIPRTKELDIIYKIMEPQETFISTTIRRPNVQTRLPLKVEPLKVKPKGWGDIALRVTPTDLQ